MMVMAPVMRHDRGDQGVGENDPCYAAPPQDNAPQDAMASSCADQACAVPSDAFLAWTWYRGGSGEAMEGDGADERREEIMGKSIMLAAVGAIGM